MNKVFISGRLVRDPESKITSSGKTLCTFSIANDLHYRDNKKTGFYNIKVWGNMANIITEYYTKGQEIFITGRLDHNKWKDQEGKNRNDVSIILENFDFGSKPRYVNSDISINNGETIPKPFMQENFPE